MIGSSVILFSNLTTRSAPHEKCVVLALSFLVSGNHHKELRVICKWFVGVKNIFPSVVTHSVILLVTIVSQFSLIIGCDMSREHLDAASTSAFPRNIMSRSSSIVKVVDTFSSWCEETCCPTGCAMCCITVSESQATIIESTVEHGRN